MSTYTKPYEDKMNGAIHHLGKELAAIRADLDLAIEEFNRRSRRFGGI